MAEMGKYCRAYQLKDLRAFAGWREDASAMNREADGDGDGARTGFADDDVLYVQEDLTVTDGIFRDEHIVFADVTPEWTMFCGETLGFAVPVWERAVDAEAPEAGRGE